MALTARKSLRLEDNRLANLYKKHASLWAGMAKDAYDCGRTIREQGRGLRLEWTRAAARCSIIRR